MAVKACAVVSRISINGGGKTLHVEVSVRERSKEMNYGPLALDVLMATEVNGIAQAAKTYAERRWGIVFDALDTVYVCTPTDALVVV